VGAEDLMQLVTNGVSEGRSLEYKEVRPGETDSERKEFLADASAFANGAGGDLIYGVRERRDDAGKPTGVADAIVGLTMVNLDAEIRRLEGMLRDGIAPRIPGTRLHAVAGFEHGPALILRVPRSWAGPHMVTYQQHSRFYTVTAAANIRLMCLSFVARFFEQWLTVRTRSRIQSRAAR
jgi:predicted HTH transcriptional regulator